VVFIIYGWRIARVAHYRLLAGFYLMAAVMMTISMTLQVNTQFYNVLYLLSTLCLGYYFIALLESKIKKYTSVALVITLVIYFTLSTLFGWNDYLDSRGHALSSIILLCMMFMYYHQFMNDVRDESIATNFDFWFVSGQLLYQMGSFGIFLSYNYLTQKILPDGNYTLENRTTLTYLWMVHNVLLFLSALITAASLVWKVYLRKLPS
jgi:hypothetical protein